MSSPLIFDRKRVKLHRDRAARTQPPCDFLLAEMASRLCDRLDDITRMFPLALDLGAHHGLLAKHLEGKGGIQTLVQSDISAQMLCHTPSPLGGGLGWGLTCSVEQDCPPPSLPPIGGGILKIVADEEFLPFAENSFDLVISCGSLHWVNDLPGALIQIRHVLKPDGLFLAMLPGGETLKELRTSFERAEMVTTGGVSPRVSPFVDVRDAGGLLQRAGFALPVADSEMLKVTYDHPLKLLKELRAMGETSALIEGRKGLMPCSLMMAMADYYLQHFEAEEGRIAATFELVTLTGWKPHPSQQQPAKRGSGQVNLANVLR